MSTAETVGERAPLSPAEQLTLAFCAVAEATNAEWLLHQQPSLNEVFDDVITEHHVTPETQHLLETGLLVRIASNGLRARLNEQSIQRAQHTKRDAMLSLQRVLLELHDSLVAVSTLDGHNDIEYDLTDRKTSQFATESYVASASGNIVGYHVNYDGSLLFLERGGSLRKWQKRAQFIAKVFNPQTGEPLVKIEDVNQ